MNREEPYIPYQRHSETSKVAAEKMAGSSGTHRHNVYMFIKGKGLASDEGNN